MNITKSFEAGTQNPPRAEIPLSKNRAARGGEAETTISVFTLPKSPNSENWHAELPAQEE